MNSVKGGPSPAPGNNNSTQASVGAYSLGSSSIIVQQHQYNNLSMPS